MAALYSGRILVRNVWTRAVRCSALVMGSYPGRSLQSFKPLFDRIADSCEEWLDRVDAGEIPASTTADQLPGALTDNLRAGLAAIEEQLGDPYAYQNLLVARDLTNKETPRLCTYSSDAIEHVWTLVQEMAHMVEYRETTFTTHTPKPPAAICTTPKITTLTCEVTIPGMNFDAIEFVRNHEPAAPILGIKTRLLNREIIFKGGHEEGHAKWSSKGFHSCVTLLVARDPSIGKKPYYTAKVFCTKDKIQVTGVPSDDPSVSMEPFLRVRAYLSAQLKRQLPPLEQFRIHMFNTRWQILPLRRTELTLPVRVNYARLGRVLDDLIAIYAATGELPFAPHFDGVAPVLHNHVLAQNKQRHMKIHFAIEGKEKELPLVIWPSAKANIQGGCSKAVNAFIYGWIANVTAYHAGIIW